MSNFEKGRHDEAMKKGAVEEDSPDPSQQSHPQNGSFASQLGHRDQDEMIKQSDTDFPGPDAEPEHTGKP